MNREHPSRALAQIKLSDGESNRMAILRMRQAEMLKYDKTFSSLPGNAHASHRLGPLCDTRPKRREGRLRPEPDWV